jgi:cytoskeleton protein RodZ
MATIGKRLKHARDERGLTVEDVAFHTRIPAARVRDMENDDLSRFANLTYARGFLKIYAEYLQLDLGDYLGQFHTEEFAHASGHEYVQMANATQNLPPAAVFADRGRTRQPGLYLLVVAILAAGGVVWWNSRADREEEARTPILPAAVIPPPGGAGPISPLAVTPGPTPEATAPPSVPLESPSVPVSEMASTASAPAPPPAEQAGPATHGGPPPKAKVIEEEQP